MWQTDIKIIFKETERLDGVLQLGSGKGQSYNTFACSHHISEELKMDLDKYRGCGQFKDKSRKQ